MGPDGSMDIAQLVNGGGIVGTLALVYLCIMFARKLLQEFRSDAVKNAVARAENAENERNQLLAENTARISELERQVEKLREELQLQREDHDKQLRDQDAQWRARMADQRREADREVQELRRENDKLQHTNWRQRQLLIQNGIDPDGQGPVPDVQ